MKTSLKQMLLTAFLTIGGMSVYAQANDPEVPGDNFSLEGALELFKKSASPEEFEQLLNSPDSKVNNLDLNGDGDIDYIKVIDRNEGNVHAFILQAVISNREQQDIAVIELEKLANGKAILQIVGDADIYGIETIIEPTREVRVNAGTSTARTIVNVWAWPSVQYIYGPYYSVWVSPWGWSMRPVWWSPWRPINYYVYDPYWAPYRPYYSVWHSHRVVYAHRIYRPMRTTSVVVYNRHHQQIDRYRSNPSNTMTRGRDNRTYNNGRSDSDNRSRSNNRSITRPDGGSRTTDRMSQGRTRSSEGNQRSSTSGNRSGTGTRDREISPSRSNSRSEGYTPPVKRSDAGTTTSRQTPAPRMRESGSSHQRPAVAPQPSRQAPSSAPRSGGSGGSRSGGSGSGGRGRN